MASDYAALLKQAAAGELDGWCTASEGSSGSSSDNKAKAAAGAAATTLYTSPHGCLALIVLLDQFSRNIHRGTPAAWATDSAALKVCLGAIEAGLDLALPPFLRFGCASVGGVTTLVAVRLTLARLCVALPLLLLSGVSCTCPWCMLKS